MPKCISKRITPGFVRCRVKSPSKFVKSSFRTLHPDEDTEVIIGRLKGSKYTTTQAILKRRK